MANGPSRRRRSTRPDARGPVGHPDPGDAPAPWRELIVIARPGAVVRASQTGVPVAEMADLGALSRAFAPPDVNLVPLFGRPEARIREAVPFVAEAAEAAPLDLGLFYRVEAPHDQLGELAAQVRENEAFEAAYFKPPTELPDLNTQVPALGEPPAVTPDFSGQQGYLGPAPGGIDARHAWTLPGGDGRGVGIIDIEGAWRFTHEGLTQLGGLVGGGVQQPGLDWRNHGTAVLGVLGGGGDGRGVTGICPGARIRAISHSGPGQNTASAIHQAADLLGPGDLILLEAHRPGPAAPEPFAPNPQQRGYIAIEWWPDDYAAIAYAVRKGIVVVGAAGNGSVDLDAAIYDQHPDGSTGFGPFPSWWENPFRRARLNSGAILVGAGAPPSGDFGPDRSRLDFSNYGVSVDVQGWGRGVVTAGYGDLQGPSLYEDLWYTRSFSGTSSASPIVVGALACLQGALKASGAAPLTSPRARELLRSTGSAQVPGQSQEAAELIGTRPDLNELLAALRIVPGPATEDQGSPKVVPARGVAAGTHEGEQPGVRPDRGVPPEEAGPSSLLDRIDRLENRLDQLARFIGVPI